MNTKKVLSALVLGCVVFSFVVTFCGAVGVSYFPMPQRDPYFHTCIYTEEQYIEEITARKQRLPHNFVSLDALRFSGSFAQLLLYIPNTGYVEYDAKKHVWKYEYEFELTRTETEIYTAVIEIRHCKMDEIEATASLDALADSADMRLLDAAYHGEEQNLHLGSAIYHYDAEGRLRWIKWEDGNRTFTLTVDTLEHIRDSYWWNREGDMTDYEGEGIVAELLNAKTAKGALREFRMRVALGAVSDETYIVIAVCAVAIALVVIFLVMRKKRGALAPAMAGAPAGEVSTGSDGDTSAATVGAAHAAPESPTPPEEDTKTDDFDRS